MSFEWLEDSPAEQAAERERIRNSDWMKNLMREHQAKLAAERPEPEAEPVDWGKMSEDPALITPDEREYLQGLVPEGREAVASAVQGIIGRKLGLDVIEDLDLRQLEAAGPDVATSARAALMARLFDGLDHAERAEKRKRIDKALSLYPEAYPAHFRQWWTVYWQNNEG